MGFSNKGNDATKKKGVALGDNALKNVAGEYVMEREEFATDNKESGSYIM